ncbi:FirrV-1-C5 [Feldmannia irregularis virus a]|uniref:FirrV-1-C5 n=1 Tax=Feldmannia irregularis virus a TaxID=231992 RepID=Q6XLX3_9PHYC|nr:FirrV-1-C5 [Feldmannia irregularis virus a]AAR26938.1 FirrV-1-C5 [Feldmannia irregularis virus a]
MMTMKTRHNKKRLKEFYFATEQYDMIELLCEDWRTPEERLGLAIKYGKYKIVHKLFEDGVLLSDCDCRDAIRTGNLWIVERAVAQGLFNRSKNENAMDRVRDVVEYGTVRMAHLVICYENIELNTYSDFRVSLLGHSLCRKDVTLDLSMTKYLLAQGADETLRPFCGVIPCNTIDYLIAHVKTEESIHVAVSLLCFPCIWRRKYGRFYLNIVSYL